MRFIPVILTGLLLAACGYREPSKLGPEEYRSATGAAATVGETVTVLGMLMSVVPQAYRSTIESLVRILNAAKSNLDASLQSAEAAKADPSSVGKPLTTAAAIIADAPKAAAEAEKNAESNEQRVKEEQKAHWFVKLLQWGGWATVAGAGLWVARAFNVPGINLISDPLLRMLAGEQLKNVESKAAEFAARLNVARKAVESSDVARQGLALLDQFMTPELRAKIKGLTGDRADSVEGLFKLLAKGHAVDSGVQGEVDALLTSIRNEMPTTGGLADALLGTLATFQRPKA